jgi:adenylate cyclase class 2
LPALRYEKFREVWALLGCEVCLDTLPFGDFAEIEGDEADIRACAEALNLPEHKASCATYHDLNRQACAARGARPDESFVFTAEHKARLLPEPGPEPK